MKKETLYKNGEILMETITTESKKSKEQIKELVSKHNDLVIAIVQDYIGGPEMELEIETANEKLLLGLEEIQEDEKELDFKEWLELGETVEMDHLAVLEYIEPNVSDQNLFDAMGDPASAESDIWCIVKVPSMNLRSKLEEFIKTEIYPAYKDQRDYTNIL